jgi:hypothetical protein
MGVLVPLAVVADLDALLEVDVTDTDRAEALLASASTLVRAATGSAWVDANGDLLWEAATDANLKLVGDALTDVTVAAAARAYRNPSGETQKSVGDVSVSYGGSAASGVYLTDDEKRMLAEAVALYRGRSAPGLWTLSTTRSEISGGTDLGTLYDGTYYAEVTPTGQDLPWLDADQLA